jgi:hypothetical protein
MNRFRVSVEITDNRGFKYSAWLYERAGSDPAVQLIEIGVPEFQKSMYKDLDLAPTVKQICLKGQGIGSITKSLP